MTINVVKVDKNRSRGSLPNLHKSNMAPKSGMDTVQEKPPRTVFPVIHPISPSPELSMSPLHINKHYSFHTSLLETRQSALIFPMP